MLFKHVSYLNTMIFVDIWTNSPVIQMNRKYDCHFYHTSTYWKFVKNVNNSVNYINLLNLPIRHTLSKKNSNIDEMTTNFSMFPVCVLKQ